MVKILQIYCCPFYPALRNHPSSPIPRSSNLQTPQNSMPRASYSSPLPNFNIKPLLLRLTYAILDIITPPATMLWTWITLTLFVMFITWVAAVARFRSSMTKAYDDLRLLARDFRQQAQQLTSIQQSERESKRESIKRGRELTTLRNRVQSLTSSLHTVTAERDSLKSQIGNAEARISRLSEQLAASHANNDTLRIELEDATQIRWKLMSRIHTDAAHRALKFDQLQPPRLSLPQTPPSTDEKPSFSITPAIEGPSTAPDHSEDTTPSASAAPSSLPTSDDISEQMTNPHAEHDIVAAVEHDLNHSVSIEHLLELQPDLSVPEYHDSFVEPSELQSIDADFGSRKLESSQTMHVIARDDGKQPLSLDRVPWVDTASPNLPTQSSAISIAAALQPTNASKPSGWIVSGMRGTDTT